MLNNPSKPRRKVEKNLDTLTLSLESNTTVRDTNECQPSASGWVTKHDRHIQLINNSIFDKDVLQRNKAIERTQAQKALKRDQREKSQIYKHLQTIGAETKGPLLQIMPNSSGNPQYLSIDGLKFEVCADGSKLSRMFGAKAWHGNTEKVEADAFQVQTSQLGRLLRELTLAVLRSFEVSMGIYIARVL